VRLSSVPCTKVSGTSATVFLNRSVRCDLFQMAIGSLIWARSSGRRKYATFCHVTTRSLANVDGRYAVVSCQCVWFCRAECTGSCSVGLVTAVSVLGSAERSVPAAA
jgi:hypothetical protein